MSDREQHRVRLDPLRLARTAWACYVNGRDDPTVDSNVVDMGIKPYLAAEIRYATAQSRANRRQPVAADVRARVDQNVRIRAMLIQRFQNVPAQRIVHPGIELSVAVGTGPALAVQQVRGRIKHAVTVERLHDIPVAAAHFASALQHQRTVTVLRQPKRREHPTRSEADDDGAVRRNDSAALHRLGLLRLEPDGVVGTHPFEPRPLLGLGLVKRDLHLVGKVNVLLPCVHRTAYDGVRPNRGTWHLQPIGHCVQQLVLGIVQPEANVTYQKGHGEHASVAAVAFKLVPHDLHQSGLGGMLTRPRGRE